MAKNKSTANEAKPSRGDYICVIFLYIGLGIIKMIGADRDDTQTIIDVVLDALWPDSDK